MADLERTLATTIQQKSKSFRVLLLNGQRQVGKSTLLKNIACGTDRNYVSLDDMLCRQLAKSDPELFLQQYSPPVIIDEIQYAPELFPYIKIYCDKYPRDKGAFWLTGSQKYKLMHGVQESLAGRIGIFDLFGFSYREKMRKPFSSKPFIPAMECSDLTEKLTISDLYQLIWEGSLPEVVLDMPDDKSSYFSSYIQSYIERDVRDVCKVEKPIQFFAFITVVAAQTGQLLNYTSIARDIGIDIKTAQSWMGILERSGIVYLLHPYTPNITSRIVKTPKMYFLDTGLCAYLTKWLTPETLLAGSMSGHILETYVVAEILKSYHHNGREPSMFFYRDTEKREIDIVLSENGTLYPIEIKKTANPSLSDCKNFKLLEKYNKKIGTGAIICLQPQRVALSRDVVSIPVWEI
jgi:hypothetical protein